MMRYIKNYSDFLLEKKETLLLTTELENVLKMFPVKKIDRLRTSIIKNLLDKYKTEKSIANLKTYDKLNFLYAKYPVNRIYSNKLNNIEDYIVANPDVYLPNDIEEIVKLSDEWHISLESDDISNIERTDETENTDRFLEFPDMYYWINLNTEYSADEANNMGHCGRDAGKILFSLRDGNNQSHITVSYSRKEEGVYQIKGRNNSKPKEIYHPYIIALFLNEKYPIKFILSGSYKPENDFNMMDLTETERKDLLSAKPSLEYTDSIFEDYLNHHKYTECVAILMNGYRYKGYEKYVYTNAIDAVLDIVEEKDFSGKDAYNDIQKDVIIKNMINVKIVVGKPNLLDILKRIVKLTDITILPDGSSGLVICLNHNTAEAVEILLQSGVNPNEKERFIGGLIPLSNYISKINQENDDEYYKKIDLMLKYGAKSEMLSLLKIIFRGDEILTNILIDYKFYIGYDEGDIKTCIERAKKEGFSKETIQKMEKLI